MKRKNLILSIVSIVAALALTSCNDFLDITPTGKVIAKTGEEYRALLTYEYKYFAKDRYMTTLRTDELLMDPKRTSSTDLDAYLDLWRWKDENPSPTTSYFSWRNYYHAIYIANYLIEHQKEITDATTDEVEQMVGEAYMMRAYCHFLLVNLYADDYNHCQPATTRGVPMQLEADVNAIPGSSSVEAVYQQVLADVTEAEKHLNVINWEEGENYRFTFFPIDAYDAALAQMEAMTQEELVAEILDERARELAFEGHRWYDLRRTTQPALTRTYNGETFTLTPEKYTMRFPTEAVEANPEIERW